MAIERQTYSIPQFAALMGNSPGSYYAAIKEQVARGETPRIYGVEVRYGHGDMVVSRRAVDRLIDAEQTDERQTA